MFPFSGHSSISIATAAIVYLISLGISLFSSSHVHQRYSPRALLQQHDPRVPVRARRAAAEIETQREATAVKHLKDFIFSRFFKRDERGKRERETPLLSACPPTQIPGFPCLRIHRQNEDEDSSSIRLPSSRSCCAVKRAMKYESGVESRKRNQKCCCR